MKRVLILGRSGQIASALRSRLVPLYPEVSTLGRDRLDLSSTASIRSTILAINPDVVINAAAYTAVDRAEDEPGLAQALNADGPGEAAAAAACLGIPFIQFSTDYVFDGSAGRPYVEEDAPNPLGVYGRTKLAGEQAVMAANPRHVILRTAWVCSPNGQNFVRTMLRLAAQRDELGVVADQVGHPTFAGDLADLVQVVLERLDDTPSADAYGVFHAVGQGDTSWFELAREIMAGSAARGGPSAHVRPITTEEYPTPAKRPTDTRLSTRKLAAIYRTALPPWRESLQTCLDEIYELNELERR